MKGDCKRFESVSGVVALTIPREKIKRQILEAFEAHGCRDVCIHTDISAIGVPGPVGRGRKAISESWLSLFEEVAEGRLLRFPTFNYDYCAKRVYDVMNDRCQVGALNELVRLRYPERRTLTPVFNFSSLGEHRLQNLDGVENPFGRGSTFDEIFKSSGWVACFGVNVKVYTFLHYVEEFADIGYRYHKKFPGTLLTTTGAESVGFFFRVHPPHPPYELGYTDYDVDRLDEDLQQAGLLFRHKVGMGELTLRNARGLFGYWLDRLDSDPFYLLTPESKEKTVALSRKIGYPFTFEAVEGLDVCK